jgi:hypothetical protein
MRIRPLSLCLIAAAAPASMARAQDEMTPVYDFGDAGGVVVYEPSRPAEAAYQGEPQYIPPQDAYWYFGAHPDNAGGWDPTEGAHAHEYPPADPYLYTEENGYYYFIGDPIDFGYSGESYGYYGPHPVALADGGGYCYYDGYHHHLWAAFSPWFEAWQGWYVYNGPFSPWFYSFRDRYARYFRDQYPVHVGRPPSTHTAQPPQVTVAHPPNPVGLLPLQRLRTPAAPARPGYSYIGPGRARMVRLLPPAGAAPSPPRTLPPRVRPMTTRAVPPAYPPAIARPVPAAPARAAAPQRRR